MAQLHRTKSTKRQRSWLHPRSRLRKWWRSLTTSRKGRQYIKRTALGFFGGVFLSYLIFFAMIMQLNYSLRVATWLGCIIAVVLTLGLAFSECIQCITLLTLPQLFSKRGRSMLIAYIFLIAFSGPVANTARNTEIISASLSCGQGQLKSALKEIMTIMKQPFVAIKHAVKHIMKNIKQVLLKFRKIMIRMKVLIENILNVIKNAFNFLANVVSICNKNVGTPFQRCVRMFEQANQNCKDKLGPFEVLCNVTYLIKAICYSVKFLDYVCDLVDFVSDAIVGVVRKKLKMFIDEIHNMLYVSVKFEHTFHFHTNTSKSLHEIKDEIYAEVKERSKSFLFIISWMHMLSGLFFCWMILKIIRYKSRFLTNDRYDNVYLNKEFFAFDRKRTELGLETVLPLKQKERNKIIKLTSCRLTLSEKFRLARSVPFLFTSTIHIVCMMLIDYCLYWLLAKIQYYGRKQAGLEAPDILTVEVIGDGIIAEMYSGIISVFTPLTKGYNVDPTPCLPNPEMPNFEVYCEIGFGLTLSWMFLIFEPYGLRLRQVVMNRYHPARARERAAWLYNKILRKRESFVKFARRAARRKFVKDKPQENETFCDLLRAKYNHIWIVRKILREGKEQFCMLCGCSLKSSNDVSYCVQPECYGRYCAECFQDLKGTCPICMKPIDYGDVSDISEEMGSSDDDDLSRNYMYVEDPERGLEFQFEVLQNDFYERTKFL